MAWALRPCPCSPARAAAAAHARVSVCGRDGRDREGSLPTLLLPLLLPAGRSLATRFASSIPVRRSARTTPRLAADASASPLFLLLIRRLTLSSPPLSSSFPPPSEYINLYQLFHTRALMHSQVYTHK